ncbi:MAG: hypothetical protein RJB66_552 [Pseudomonadota bacterium]|jgi:hypothetical protein
MATSKESRDLSFLNLFRGRLKNEFGFSLTSVTIGAAILGILILVIAEIFKISNNSFQQVRMSNDLQTVQNLVQMSLAEPEVCRSALQVNGAPLTTYNFPFQDPPVAKVNLSDIQMNGKTLLNTLGGYRIEAKLFSPAAPGTSVQLVDRRDSTLKAFNKNSVIISLNGIRSDDPAGTISIRARIPISIITGPLPGSPNTFYDCATSSQDYKAMCEVLGGQYEPSKSPPCLLKKLGIANNFNDRENMEAATPNMGLYSREGALINGVIIGHSSTGVDMAYPYESIGVGNPGHNLRLQSPGTIALHTAMTASEPDNNSKVRLMITNAGNVGVGKDSPRSKLDVSGEVIVGNTNSVNCNTDAEGAIRYNKVTHQMEICGGGDGSATNPPTWKPVGRAATCHDKVFGGDKAVDGEEISRFLVGVCDDGCYISKFIAKGGELHIPDHKCTATSKRSIGVRLVQSNRHSPTTEFNFAKGSESCAESVRCHVEGTPIAGYYPKAINVQMSSNSGGGANCYENYLKIFCSPL